MKDSLYIQSVPPGRNLHIDFNSYEAPDSEAVICVERTPYGCCHDYKASSILDRPVSKSILPHTSRYDAPLNSNSDDLLVFPSCEVYISEKSCSIIWFISNRSCITTDYKRYIFCGERNSPFFDLFLLYSYSLEPYIFENSTLVSVSQEGVRRISHRFSLSEKAKNCKKLGCLVDSAAGVNSAIIAQLYKLGSKYDFKVYPISIGKIEDYKLGNFCDIDLFVNLQCQFCFDFKEKYSTPVLTYYEFVSGIFGCFWDSNYGDYSALLLKEQTELLTSNISGYIENRTTDFKTDFACRSKTAFDVDTRTDEATFIVAGHTGTPMSYKTLL